MRINVLFLIIIFTISSCYREVKIDFPKQEVLPVVNSILQTDSVISVTLSKTQPILENGPTEITDALVMLYEDGQEKELLEFDGNSFKSREVAVANKEYNIRVEISGFETVTAEERLVDFPKIISSSYKDSVYIGDEGDLFSQITLEIENTTERDYYELDMRLKVLLSEEGETDEEPFYGVRGSPLFFDPVLNDLVIQNEGLLSFFPTELVFSDELMTVGSHTLRINYRPFNTGLYNNSSNSEIILIMEIRKVSKNYYEYKKTLTQHLDTQFGDVWDGVGQPLSVFNNIKNGYGIFAGYSQVIDTIQKQ